MLDAACLKMDSGSNSPTWSRRAASKGTEQQPLTETHGKPRASQLFVWPSKARPLNETAKKVWNMACVEPMTDPYSSQEQSSPNNPNGRTSAIAPLALVCRTRSTWRNACFKCFHEAHAAVWTQMEARLLLHLKDEAPRFQTFVSSRVCSSSPRFGIALVKGIGPRWLTNTQNRP